MTFAVEQHILLWSLLLWQLELLTMAVKQSPIQVHPRRHCLVPKWWQSHISCLFIISNRTTFFGGNVNWFWDILSMFAIVCHHFGHVLLTCLTEDLRPCFQRNSATFRKLTWKSKHIKSKDYTNHYNNAIWLLDIPHKIITRLRHATGGCSISREFCWWAVSIWFQCPDARNGPYWYSGKAINWVFKHEKFSHFTWFSHLSSGLYRFPTRFPDPSRGFLAGPAGRGVSWNWYSGKMGNGQRLKGRTCTS